MSAPDPETPSFLEEQRAAWNSVARGWQAWAATFERAAQPLNDRMVELAAVAPGHRVLDVATGIGEPALTAARRVGAGGSVLAADASEEMLAVASERAAAAGLDGVVRTEVHDAEDLGVPAGAFDAGLCRWGLMLLLEPGRGARGIHRALRPGARVAAAVWRSAAEVPFLATPRRVLTRELGLPAPDPDAPGPLRLGAEGALAEVLERAGFVDVRVESFPVVFEFEDGDEYWRFLLDLSSSTRRVLAELAEDELARVRDSLLEEMRAHADARGRLRVENRTWIGTGAVGDPS